MNYWRRKRQKKADNDFLHPAVSPTILGVSPFGDSRITIYLMIQDAKYSFASMIFKLWRKTVNNFLFWALESYFSFIPELIVKCRSSKCVMFYSVFFFTLLLLNFKGWASEGLFIWVRNRSQTKIHNTSSHLTRMPENDLNRFSCDSMSRVQTHWEKS